MTTPGSRLAGRTTLITGAASGLGRVAAELFASEGSSVVIADVGDGSEVVEAITAAGGEAAYASTDVTDEESVRAAVDFAVETFGGLHVLYNNAGVSLGDDDGVTNTERSVWDTTLSVNVTGVALGLQARHPRHAAHPGGGRRRRPERIDHQRRQLRRPHGRGHPPDRLHGVQGGGGVHDP